MKMLNGRKHAVEYQILLTFRNRNLNIVTPNIMYFNSSILLPQHISHQLYVMTLLTLCRYSGGWEIFLLTHLVFNSIVHVVQVQFFNLMSGDKVLTPCWNGLSKQGLKYQAAYMIAYWFPCVPNHNRVVAFHIMFIITAVTAH